MKRLSIKHLDVGGGLFRYYEFKLKDLLTGDLILSDSIDDTGQGEEKATEQIHNILRRKGFIQ